jgi:tetratricopeptide (TPR) repeat protein
MQYLFVTLCLFSWLTSNLAAQSATGDPKAWKRYQSAGEKALKAKNSVEAERQFTLAVAEAEKIRKGEGKLQESLDDLAPLLVNHRKYEAALAAYERLCVLYAKDVGSNSLKVAEALFGFAQACKFGKRLFEAEDALLRARAIIERKTEPTHTARILVQGELASVHSAQGRLLEAESLYKSAIELAENPRVHYKQYADGAIQERRYLPPYQLLGSLRNDLGLLYGEQRRWAEAEDSFKRAQRLYQTGGGKDNSGVALALANLGHLYLQQMKFAEAQAALEQSLAIREKGFAPNHPLIADTLEALAAAQHPGNPELAKTTLKRALQIRGTTATQ